MYDANGHLRIVQDNPGAFSILRDALEKKGVRFDKSDFVDNEITINNHNVMSFRGRAYDVIHGAFERHERRVARKKAAIAFINCHLASVSGCYEIIKIGIRYCWEMVAIHKRVPLTPNDPAQARRAKGARIEARASTGVALQRACWASISPWGVECGLTARIVHQYANTSGIHEEVRRRDVIKVERPYLMAGEFALVDNSGRRLPRRRVAHGMSKIAAFHVQESPCGLKGCFFAQRHNAFAQRQN
jgi:hypothetical protein